MPMTLEGSCACGAVRFTVASHTPVPYQLCYCEICVKSAGAGGPAIMLGGVFETLKVEGAATIGVYRARIEVDGQITESPAERSFCKHCGTALWAWDPRWPELVHPSAAAIDTPLPVPPVRTHIFLRSKPAWMAAEIGPGDTTFDGYPELSLEDWHKAHGLWVE